MSGRSVGETAARVRTGVSERDTRNRRKALAFFRLADTVEWIAGRSGERIDADPRPVPPAEAASPPGGARIRYREAGRADAAFGFAPESTEAPPGKATDAYDVPVATDALAEGMNLQQCGRIADYDLPWNPARAGPAARTHRPHRKSPRGGEARRDFMAPRGFQAPGVLGDVAGRLSRGIATAPRTCAIERRSSP